MHEGEDVRYVPTIDDKDKDISKPKLILLDCLEKDLDTYLLELESSGENILYRHLVALFNVSHGLGIEEKALKKGIRGFFTNRSPWSNSPGVFMLFLTGNCGFQGES
ncbi:MAG: hypothetical protein JSU78_03690 [Deltaproteobacteria bacterium]|nr:MAG: hypothetical protein JSU78_03690 [Deltaproteobacteria bacterium]